MKVTTYLILVIITIAMVFCEFGKSSQVEVISQNLQFSQDSNFDINAPSISEPFIKASIKGQIQNKGEKAVKNIIITYKFPRGIVIAKISALKPGQKADFTTNTYKSKNKTPGFKFESITYDVIE